MTDPAATFRTAQEASDYRDRLHRELYAGCVDYPRGAEDEAFVTKRAEYAAGIRVIRYRIGADAKGRPVHLWYVYRRAQGEAAFLADRPIADASIRMMHALYSNYGYHVLTARSSKDAHAAAEAMMAADRLEAAERRQAIRERLRSGRRDTPEFSDAEVILAMLEGEGGEEAA